MRNRWPKHIPRWARIRMQDPDAGSEFMEPIKVILPIVLTVATGGGAVLGGIVSQELLVQIITAVVGTIGGTSVVKHLGTKLVNAGRVEWQKLPKGVKNALPFVVGILTAITTGADLTDTMPVGALDDGVLIGLVSSLIYKIVKPSKPADDVS